MRQVLAGFLFFLLHFLLLGQDFRPQNSLENHFVLAPKSTALSIPIITEALKILTQLFPKESLFQNLEQMQISREGESSLFSIKGTPLTIAVRQNVRGLHVIAVGRNLFSIEVGKLPGFRGVSLYELALSPLGIGNLELIFYVGFSSLEEALKNGHVLEFLKPLPEPLILENDYLDGARFEKGMGDHVSEKNELQEVLNNHKNDLKEKILDIHREWNGNDLKFLLKMLNALMAYASCADESDTGLLSEMTSLLSQYKQKMPDEVAGFTETLLHIIQAKRGGLSIIHEHYQAERVSVPLSILRALEPDSQFRLHPRLVSVYGESLPPVHVTNLWDLIDAGKSRGYSLITTSAGKSTRVAKVTAGAHKAIDPMLWVGFRHKILDLGPQTALNWLKDYFSGRIFDPMIQKYAVFQLNLSARMNKFRIHNTSPVLMVMQNLDNSLSVGALVKKALEGLSPGGNTFVSQPLVEACRIVDDVGRPKVGRMGTLMTDPGHGRNPFVIMTQREFLRRTIEANDGYYGFFQGDNPGSADHDELALMASLLEEQGAGIAMMVIPKKVILKFDYSRNEEEVPMGPQWSDAISSLSALAEDFMRVEGVVPLLNSKMIEKGIGESERKRILDEILKGKETAQNQLKLTIQILNERKINFARFRDGMKRLLDFSLILSSWGHPGEYWASRSFNCLLKFYEASGGLIENGEVSDRSQPALKPVILRGGALRSINGINEFVQQERTPASQKVQDPYGGAPATEVYKDAAIFGIGNYFNTNCLTSNVFIPLALMFPDIPVTNPLTGRNEGFLELVREYFNPSIDLASRKKIMEVMKQLALERLLTPGENLAERMNLVYDQYYSEQKSRPNQIIIEDVLLYLTKRVAGIPMILVNAPETDPSGNRNDTFFGHTKTFEDIMQIYLPIAESFMKLRETGFSGFDRFSAEQMEAIQFMQTIHETFSSGEPLGEKLIALGAKKMLSTLQGFKVAMTESENFEYNLALNLVLDSDNGFHGLRMWNACYEMASEYLGQSIKERGRAAVDIQTLLGSFHDDHFVGFCLNKHSLPLISSFCKLIYHIAENDSRFNFIKASLEVAFKSMSAKNIERSPNTDHSA